MAILYLKGRFWLDVLSTVPFEFLFGSNGVFAVFKLFGLLKVVRVTRISRIINLMNVKADFKMILRLTNLVYFLLLYIHFSACIWWYTIKDTKIWIPPMDYMYLKTDTYSLFSLELQYMQ